MQSYSWYKNTFSSKEIKQLATFLNQISFESLDLTAYNLAYILKIKPSLFYHFQMFEYTMNHLFQGENSKDKWIVDFGGGHGFLSLFLKLKGFKVIYCDFNSNSLDTIQKISEELNFGADEYVLGSSKELLEFIQANGIILDYLISTDTIEHIDDLKVMFSNFRKLNPKLEMIFTTASNPKNYIKSAQLRKLMIVDEMQEYRPMRRAFILENFPELEKEIIDQLAEKSRGLKYDDLIDFVNYYKQNQKFQSINVDRYNTCEPVYGAWMERILPLKDYHEFALSNQFKLEISNGFYNVNDKEGLKKIVVENLNQFILNNKKSGFYLSPFILLKYTPK